MISGGESVRLQRGALLASLNRAVNLGELPFRASRIGPLPLNGDNSALLRALKIVQNR
jgi:hypothetical protein